MCGEEEEREKKKSKQYHPEKKNQQQQYFQVLMRETSSRLPFGHDTHNRIVHESHQEQTSKQMVKQTTTTKKKCPSVLRGKAATIRHPCRLPPYRKNHFFFLIIEFSSRHKVIEGRIIENQTRYATWKEQKKKKQITK